LIALVARKRGKVPLWVPGTIWAATEVLLPNIFPTYMALSWCWQPLWIQTAEIGGVATVAFTMLAINTGLWQLLQTWLSHRRIDRNGALFAAAFLILVPAYGSLRIHQVRSRAQAAPKLKIGVVQGNFGIATYTVSPMKRRILDELRTMSAELEREGADMVLWGETAYPYTGFFRDSPGDRPAGHPRRMRDGFTIPLVVGMVTRDRESPRFPWNTAWVLQSNGLFGDRYDKNYPLIFGEYVPLVDPDWYLDLVPTASHLNTGDGPAAFDVAGFRLGPLICYEDILPQFARSVEQEGVHAFINLTNDSWFGATRAQAEHLGLAIFRAIEHRRGLVRAVNAGISAYVDPVGEVIQSTEVTDSDTDGYRGASGFVAEVPMMEPDQRTLYGRTGLLFGLVCALASLGACFWRPRGGLPTGRSEASISQ
jgi:apolipoprotein N-acyltransferase